MANYRTIRMSFWNDPFVEEMTAEAKLLYLYLFTSPHTNNLGILEITRRKMSFETGLSETSIASILTFLESAGKVVMDGNAIWLCNFIKNQTAISDKMIAGLKALFTEVQSEKIRAKAIERYPSILGGKHTPTNRKNAGGASVDISSKGIDTPSKGIEANPVGMETPHIPILKDEFKREREIKREDKDSLPLPLPREGNGGGEDKPSNIPGENKALAHAPCAMAKGTNKRSLRSNPRANGTNLRAQEEQQDTEDGLEREPSIEFQELRQFWDKEMRCEGPLAGFREYKTLKKARDQTGMSCWPGIGVILNDVEQRKSARIWNPGYGIGLGRYLAEKTWLAPIVARASPTPALAVAQKSDGDTAARKTWENYQRLKAQGVVE